MPVFELGYRAYDGALISPRLRWWAIMRTGIALAWKGKILRKVQQAAWLPLLYMIPLFFGIGLMLDPTYRGSNHPMLGVARELFGGRLVRAVQEDPEAFRTTIWLLAFSFFTGTIQPIITGLVITIIAPPLISNDVRTKAFLVYFSKPISRWEYVLGKLGTVLFFSFTTTLFPAVALYMLSIAFSPSFATLFDTLTVLPKITLGCLALTVPSALVALYISSVTSQPRFAAVGWVVAVVFGQLAYGVLSETSGLRHSAVPHVLSLFQSVHTLQLGILDVGGVAASVPDNPIPRWLLEQCTPDRDYSPYLALGVLIVISGLCILGIFKRIAAPMKV